MISKLEFFIAVAKEKHFGKAAASLGITQPTLSAGIQNLENQLDVMLIKRGTRFQELTLEGQRVLDWAQKICADARTMKEEIRSLKKGMSGLLRIGVIPSAETMIPNISNSFLKKYPNVKIEFYSRSSHSIILGLEQFELDLGITYLENEPLGKLTSIPLFSESYCLVAHKTFKLTDKPSVSWRDMENIKLCLLTQNMQNRRILNYHFKNAGVTVKAQLEADSILSLIAHIESGQWASILPETLANLVNSGDSLITIPLIGPVEKQKIGLVALDRQPHSPLISAILKRAKTFF